MGFVLLLLFTNPFLSNEAWLAWEPRAVLMQDVKTYDAGIVLTGVTEVNKARMTGCITTKGQSGFWKPFSCIRWGS
ncbi:hypothetical protein [Rufibacter latericius]|nr:hypothetical protein [Rufibacter latericius]